MPTNILMPALSPTMEKGNLARWLKKEGDTIKSGDVIAEIETDKATMEYEAVDEGTLAKIVVPEGTQDVAVNAVIAVLAGEGEDVKAAAAGAKAAPSAEARPKRQSRKPPRRKLPHRPPQPAASPRPAACACVENRCHQAGKQPHLLFAARAPPRQGSQHRSHPRAGLRPAWPRHRARYRRGKIRQRRSIAPARAGRCAMRAAAAAAMPSDQQIRALYEDGSYDFVPHDQIRRVIAQRLTASIQTIPHFYETVDCDIGKLMEARAEINDAAPKDKDGNPAYKLSVNDFVIKALALALQRVPDANVSWTEGGMLKHKHSDVSVAVALPGGLITPIIRNAESKSLSAISNEMRDLAARARAGKLKPHEYQGGTTSVSNLGMYGIKDFTAVINPPQSTILAVGAGEERAVVRNGALAVATIMSVTLSCDHRAVDGALGAELISAFKTLIENPVMMLV